MKSHHYWKAIEAFKKHLRDAVPHDELKALHVRSGAEAPRLRGAAVRDHRRRAATRCGTSRTRCSGCPFADPAGLHVLQHDDPAPRGGPQLRVRQAAAARWNRVARPRSTRSTSGISASQFTRWHLDHHDNLGSWEDDPKRHWLSPKRNARWFKLLYCTPALIPIYFRAAASEARSYPRGAAPHDRARAAGDGGLPARRRRRPSSHFGGWGAMAARVGGARTSSSSRWPSRSTASASTTTSTPRTRSSGRR